MSGTRQVQVPHTYFQKAKSEYSDWRWAMIREFIQNAYDAHATTIDFRLTINTAGRIELHVNDDGIGIDRDTRGKCTALHGRLQKANNPGVISACFCPSRESFVLFVVFVL